jgi:F0F1-type ATP synthase membrane subunit b/b'
LIEARNEAESILQLTEKALARERAEAPGELPEEERRATSSLGSSNVKDSVSAMR